MANPHPEEINPRLWYGTCKAAYLLGIDKNTVLAKAKIGSSMTLFDYVSPNDVFDKVLAKFFSGSRDLRSLSIIKNLPNK